MGGVGWWGRELGGSKSGSTICQNLIEYLLEILTARYTVGVRVRNKIRIIFSPTKPPFLKEIRKLNKILPMK